MHIKKAHQLALVLTLILLTHTPNIQITKASTLIYIRPDGNVDPPTAPIQRNFNVYTFTDNIQGSIIVKKDNIVIDGAAHTLQGTGSETGIDVSGRTNVTVWNLIIRNFAIGIYLSSSNHIIIIGSTISHNNHGILISSSTNNHILKNNITGNVNAGIYIYLSSNNTVFGNNIALNTFDGIYLYSSSNNTIHVNKIMDNGYGISPYYSTNNKIFHNNFINNEFNVEPNAPEDIWDNGYPSGGNYWSDYTGTDSNGDGIGDTPYEIDENNQDHYPLMATNDIEIREVKPSKTIVCQGYNASINLTLTNYGVNSENIKVTIYANLTIIGQKEITLSGEDSTILTFNWDTIIFVKGNYTISAYATPVQGETHTADNVLVDGWVIVAMVGDIIGPDGWPDGKVDVRDVAKVAKLFGVSYPDARYEANCDIIYDLKIDIKDIATVAKRYGQTDP